MKTILSGAAIAVIAGSALGEYAGIPQRVYMGRTYLIFPAQAQGPVWYAGDGRVVFGPEKSVFRSAMTKTVKSGPGPRSY